MEGSEWNIEVCKSCTPILEKYAVSFHGLKQQGSELKKRKHLNPHPKKPNHEHYRNLVKQNLWIRANIFDSMGNYLYCSKCVHKGLGISYQRLAHQRKKTSVQFEKSFSKYDKG